ncbi:hypothetical protein FJ251_15530 [bacterium]|nr:hypothetical protein [bacterium]
MSETRFTVRPGDRLQITIHGLPGRYVRWQAAAGAFREAGAILGVAITLLSGAWPSGRPR